MPYRFFRLVPRTRRVDRGRRYYRLVSYPQDCGEFASAKEAQTWAESRRYAAILCPGEQWISLNNQARQCVEWHMASKGDYIYVI